MMGEITSGAQYLPEFVPRRRADGDANTIEGRLRSAPADMGDGYFAGAKMAIERYCAEHHLQFGRFARTASGYSLSVGGSATQVAALKEMLARYE